MNPVHIVIGLLLGGLCVQAAADTVWLKNGDKLSGSIVLVDSGKLLLKTEYAGTVTLDMRKVATLESGQPLLIRHSDFVGEHAKALRPAAAGRVELINGEEPRQVELASIQRMMPPRPVIEDFSWGGKLSLSADFKRAENEIEDYDIDLDLHARHGAWRHGLGIEYDRETKNDERKTDRLEFDYQLDRFLGEKLFWQGQYKFSHDEVEDLRIQRTLGTGPGYQFWDDELGAFSLAGLFNRSDFEFVDGNSKDFSSASLSWNFNRYLYGKSLELYGKGELGVPFVEEVDYVLDTEGGLRYRLNSWAALTLKAEWDKVASEYGNTNERRYLLGVGVGW